jgi:ABC-type Fe3+ transport system permease subunit
MSAILDGGPTAIASSFRAAGVLALVTGLASVASVFFDGITAVLSALAISIWLIRRADERRSPSVVRPDPGRWRFVGFGIVAAAWSVFLLVPIVRVPAPGLVLGIGTFLLTQLDRPSLTGAAG